MSNIEKSLPGEVAPPVSEMPILWTNDEFDRKLYEQMRLVEERARQEKAAERAQKEAEAAHGAGGTAAAGADTSVTWIGIYS